jgi:Phosphotransferase enzyme family
MIWPRCPPGARWVGRADFAGAALQHDEHAAVAAGILDELAGGPGGAGRAPWAAPGWFQAAEGSLHGSLATLGYAATGPVQQLRAWELSCILRTPTAQGDVYFKAVRESPLFVNEAVVTRALAALFPDHVPAPLAIDAEHRWMALADFGAELGWDAPVQVREDVLRTFARLQIEAASQVDRLLGAGCLDRRLAWLAAQAERWLPAIDETSRMLGIDAATWLSADEMVELRAAGPQLAAMCGELAAYAVPPTLVHGDLHLSNVAHGPRGYLFFDWTDACVAHPFVDMISIFQEEEGALRDRLRDAYLTEWARFEPPYRLLRAWGLAEPLGALNHAVSYRSIVANLEPPIDPHMMQSTAYWLRKVIAGLRQAAGGRG